VEPAVSRDRSPIRGPGITSRHQRAPGRLGPRMELGSGRDDGARQPPCRSSHHLAASVDRAAATTEPFVMNENLRPRIGIQKRILFALASTLLSCLIVEAGCQLLLRVRYGCWMSPTTQSRSIDLFQISPYLGIMGRPGARVVDNANTFTHNS